MKGPRPAVAGVDGGGTAMRVLVVEADSGAELARHEGRGIHSTGGSPDALAAAVTSLVGEACTRAGVSRPLEALWVGLAGAGREAVRAELEAALVRAAGVGADVRLTRRLGVGTDVRAAFRDAFDRGPGILVVAGTGSIAWGRAEDGREARVGGWGWRLGDEGSGYALGIEALRYVVRAADGRAPASALTGAVLARLGLERLEDLVGWSSAAGPAEIAALAPDVHAVAEEGDLPALAIEARAVAALEDYVVTLEDLLGPWRNAPTVALTGGLLRLGRPLGRGAEAVLRGRGFGLLGREIDPTRGAAEEARDLARGSRREEGSS